MAAVFLAPAGLASAGPSRAAAEDATLAAAIASPLRTPAFAARDAARRPYETLRFFGLQPTHTVVEISPGGGWYTEILAPYLRDRGRLVLAADDPQSPGEFQRRGAERLQQKLQAAPQLYDRVQRTLWEVPRVLDLGPPASADRVLTFRNVHNWAARGEDATVAALRAIQAVLKPGGVLGVVDHRLPAGRLQDVKASTGYVHQAWVVQLAERAGLKLDAASEINANPRDDASHERGVWALPPTFANRDKDRERYAAIGESDRMTLRFVRP